jgi:hypothetical protein
VFEDKSIGPEMLSGLSVSCLEWLHKKMHQAASLDRGQLVQDHILVLQEIAKRGMEHEVADEFDLNTVEFASGDLGLSSEELELLGLQKQTVPPPDASTEDKRKAQKARSKRFGIEALEDNVRLSFPSDGPTKLSEYGDPVNLKFFLDTPGRARNGRVRFKQFAAAYSQTKSKAVVHERIVRAELKHGVKPSFDENDPLDKLLPTGLKDRLKGGKGSVAKVCDPDCSQCGVCSCAGDGSELTVRLLPVEKAKEDKRIVFGIVLEPGEVDAHGDTISEEVISKAAHGWLATSQDRGVQHTKIVNSKIEIFESYISPVALKIGGQKVKAGSWLLMYHVLDDDLWSDIKKGKFTGFSIGGFARRAKL